MISLGIRRSALALVLPFQALAGQQAPEREQQIARAFIDAMNATDQVSLRAFVERNVVLTGPGVLPLEERLLRLQRLRAMYGQLAIHRVAPGAPNTIDVTVQSGRLELWRRVTLHFDGGSPPRVRVFAFNMIDAPDVPQRKLTSAEIATELKTYAEHMAARDVFSGAVLLAKGTTLLYRGAFGEADKNFRALNTVDTKFNLGSMNKMFTAVAIAQLVAQGKLSFEDSLGRFLPAGTLRPEVLSKVRVKHLLSHTSGLGSYFTDEWDRMSRARLRTVDDWMQLVRNDSLRFQPGTAWAYSNTGMLVAGKVIEVASGMDYAEYVRSRITRPAGMTNTDTYDLDRVTRNLAVGYDPIPGTNPTEYSNNIFMHVIRGGPAGGGYSTVDDLWRFAKALRGGQLVSAGMVRTLTSAKPELQSPAYGYGFQLFEQGRLVGHSGGFPGICSQLDMDPRDDYVVVVLSNYSEGCGPMIEKAHRLILRGDSVSPR